MPSLSLAYGTLVTAAHKTPALRAADGCQLTEISRTCRESAVFADPLRAACNIRLGYNCRCLLPMTYSVLWGIRERGNARVCVAGHRDISFLFYMDILIINKGTRFCSVNYLMWVMGLYPFDTSKY